MGSIKDAWTDLTDPGRGDRKDKVRTAERGVEEFTGKRIPVLDEFGAPVRDEFGKPVYKHDGRGVEAPTREDIGYTNFQIDLGKYDEGELLALGDDDFVSDLDVNRTGEGQALIGQGTDFYQDVLSGGGFDPQAEADFARKRGQAQQTRQANTEAVMRNAELQGLSGSGMEALGALSSGQAQVTDESMAGLEANAMMQQNREGAAGNLVDAGSAVQDSNDAWQQWYAGEDADRQAYNADKYTDQSKFNIGRKNFVADQHVDRDAEGVRLNKESFQTEFDNKLELATRIAGERRGVGNAQGELGGGKKSVLDPGGIVSDAADTGGSYYSEDG